MKNIPGLTILQGQAACDRCKGSCCKSHPGLTSREQWVGWDEIEAALLTRKWVIDSSYDEEIFYVRPASEKSDPVFDLKIRETIGDETCVFLDPEGCVLDEADKPQQCKNLEARIVVIEIDVDDLPSSLDEPVNQCSYPPGMSGNSVRDSWREDSDKLVELGRKVEAQLSLQGDKDVQKDSSASRRRR